MEEYIKSNEWSLRVDGNEDDLINLNSRYDYLYDLFLIDKEGNILFSVAKETDLGTNLFNGPYANTRFGRSVKDTILFGSTRFSDLERYAPSNNIIAGFLTTPIFNESGESIGVFAMQLRVDRIAKLLHNQVEHFTHYLVGNDGYLRTAIDQKSDDVLNRKVSTEGFSQYLKHQNSRSLTDNTSSDTITYIGPNGKNVIGLQVPINILGTNWVLISEINEDKALSLADWLGRMTLTLVIAVTLLTVVLAFFQARRLSRPIIMLANAAKQAASGIMDSQVEISSKNEIGQLANAFNHMLLERQAHEHSIQLNHQKTQKALSDLDEQRYVLDQHAIVAVTDVKGTITYANERFSKISGYRIDELIGNNHRILNSGYHDSKYWRDMYLTVSKGNVWHGEVCNKAKDGHLYWVDTTISAFKGADGKPQAYIAIRTDISGLKKTEKALIDAKIAAEDAAKAKGEFLAVMSHEIRTPMNGVLGMLGLLEQSSLDQDQQRKVKIATTSAQFLLSLINDILDFSKVDAGKLELEEVDFNLRSHLEEFSGSMAHRAHEKGLELILDTTEVLRTGVKGDPGRIRQILTNLVGNAIKFTESGEISIHAKLEEEEPNLVFSCSVSDTGPGIPEEKLDSLFEPFTQVDASTTRNFGGTGLGLAIVKQLCELMNGSICVNSEKGKGSRFSFTLMLQPSEQSQLVVPPVNVSDLRVLIVDDNDTNRKVLRGQLEHWGIQVAEAHDAPTALALCEACDLIPQSPNHLFDVALLDMQMPKMDGAELGKIIKSDSHFKSIKLIMMTSQAHRGDAKYYADLGFSAYFPKPIPASDLLDALLVIVDGGDAFKQASPLVTRHYVHTLLSKDSPGSIEGAFNPPKWPKGTRLLSVEDNQINQEVIKGMLQKLGLSSDLAADGREALVALRQAPIDNPYTLVLMDCQMPEMDGYESSKLIREGESGSRYQNIPIVAMTANAMKGDREKCLNAGMSDYLSKPIEFAELNAMLTKWLLGNTPLIPTNTEISDSKTIESHDSLILTDDQSIAELLIWDKAAALKRLMGKEQLLTKLIKLFLSDMPSMMQALENEVRVKNYHKMVQLAHTIKGIAGNLSGLQLVNIAGELELAAKEEALDRIQVIWPKMKSAYQRLSKTFALYCRAQ